MNIFEGVEHNSMMFIGPAILFIILAVLLSIIYSIVFKKWLDKQIYNFLFPVVILFASYIWAVPMDMGFYELFKHWGM